MRRALHILLPVLAIVLILLIAAAQHLRRSLPQVEGEIALHGLGAQVEILRDAYGIPHIYTHNIADAYFALGFAHAQDRLWQMEVSRRIGSGRIAEIAGPGALEVDRIMRTLGLR